MTSQLPARSPLTLRALAAGLRGVLMGGEADRQWLRGRLQERYGARQVVLTDSGTTALRLALAAGESPVALPAYSCYDLATAAVGAGARVVLYDLEPASLQPDLPSVERALAGGARALVAAPLYGVPVDLHPLETMCAERGALLIEDAAQGIGASYRGRPLGAHGSLAVLSFARGKGWTGGGGGALLAHDDRGVETLRASLARTGPGAGRRAHRERSLPEGDLAPSNGEPRGRRGWDVLCRTIAQWTVGRPSLYGLPRRMPFLQLGETLYRDPWPPTGLPGAAAATLRASEAAAQSESRVRHAHAERLLHAIRSGSRLAPVTPPPGSEPGWLRLPALLPDGSERDIPQRLGVYRGYPKPLHALEALGPRLLEASLPAGSSPVFPGAEILAARLVTLPTHGGVRPRDLDALEAWLRAV